MAVRISGVSASALKVPSGPIPMVANRARRSFSEGRTGAAHLAAFPASTDGLVFTLSAKPITRSVFGHKWRAAVETARLPAGTGFHALRHYYASLLIRHGESVENGAVPSRPRQRGRDAGHVLPPVAGF